MGREQQADDSQQRPAKADSQQEQTELPGDPVCWLRMVCPECGTMVESEPPVTCPQCGTRIDAGR